MARGAPYVALLLLLVVFGLFPCPQSLIPCSLAPPYWLSPGLPFFVT